MEPRKQAIVTALRTWINQRPGMDPRNYDRAGYLSDSRKVQQQRRDALQLLCAVKMCEEIDADALVKAAQGAFSGRLTITEQPAVKVVRGVFVPSPIPNEPPSVRIDYCTGQYWPTEYRAAACAVLASALWDYTREHCMPTAKSGDLYCSQTKRGARVSAGDWLRAHFRQQFGRGIASRWFQ